MIWCYVDVRFKSQGRRNSLSSYLHKIDKSDVEGNAKYFLLISNMFGKGNFFYGHVLKYIKK